MATTSNRGALLRSLPALLLLILAGLFAPATVTPSAPAPMAVSYVSAEHTSTTVAPSGLTDGVDEPQPEPVPAAQDEVEDVTRALPAQLTAGSRTSRAPPARLA